MSDHSTLVRSEPFDRFSGAHLAAAGFLARYSGRTRDAYAADLRMFLAWCAARQLDVFGVRLCGDIERRRRHVLECVDGERLLGELIVDPTADDE